MPQIKGWTRRYEIIYGEVTLFENTDHERKAKRWQVIHYLGKGGVAGSLWRETERISGAPIDIDDRALLRRAGIGELTVPIVIIREGKAGLPIIPKAHQ